MINVFFNLINSRPKFTGQDKNGHQKTDKVIMVPTHHEQMSKLGWLKLKMFYI